MTTKQLTAQDYTAADAAEFRAHMTDLLAACRELATQHAPDGRWQPAAEDILGQLDEASVLIADLSRTLSTARWHIRKVDVRARRNAFKRLHSRGPTHAS